MSEISLKTWSTLQIPWMKDDYLGKTSEGWVFSVATLQISAEWVLSIATLQISAEWVVLNVRNQFENLIHPSDTFERRMITWSVMSVQPPFRYLQSGSYIISGISLKIWSTLQISTEWIVFNIRNQSDNLVHPSDTVTKRVGDSEGSIRSVKELERTKIHCVWDPWDPLSDPGI